MADVRSGAGPSAEMQSQTRGLSGQGRRKGWLVVLENLRRTTDWHCARPLQRCDDHNDHNDQVKGKMHFSQLSSYFCRDLPFKIAFKNISIMGEIKVSVLEKLVPFCGVNRMNSSTRNEREGTTTRKPGTNHS